jgi:hypothetical protein
MYSAFTPYEYNMNSSALASTSESYASNNSFPSMHTGETANSIDKMIDMSLMTIFPSQATENSSYLSSNEALNCSSEFIPPSGEYVNYIKIPKSSLGYKTNNVYPNYPPLMSDGRAIVASNQSDTIINYSFLKTSGVKTNWDYRNYLTNNSEKIRELNTLEAFNDVGYYKRFIAPPDSNQAKTIPPPDNSQTESDLKQLYKTREELNSHIYAPSINVS